MPDEGCTARRHGTVSAVAHYQCRCPQAVEKYRRYHRALRAGRAHLSPDVDHAVDGTGTRRRIHALYALGHPEVDLARALGYRNGTVPLAHRNRGRVYRSTAEKVDALYQQLRRVPGRSNHTRGRARQLGHVPPEAWPGESIDDPQARPWQPERVAPAPGDAVCAQHPDPDLWLREGARSVRQAVAGCRRCPLRRPCLSYALVHDERYGTWGGLSQERRNRVRGELGAGAVEGSPELEAVLDATTGTRC